MADDQTGAQNAGNASDDAGATNDTTNNAQSTSGDAGQGNDTSSSDSTGDVVTRAEFDRIMERMKAADRAKAAAEDKAKQLEREKLSDAEKVKADLADAVKARDSLESQLNSIRLENAFLSNNKYSWVDPSDALRLMDMEGVEIKDGKVVGLAEAIDKLAKAKPHLLKKDDGDGKGSSAASGSANNGTRKGGQKTPPKNYSARFPALRRSTQER